MRKFRCFPYPLFYYTPRINEMTAAMVDVRKSGRFCIKFLTIPVIRGILPSELTYGETGPQKLLTNIIFLTRFAIGESGILEPLPDIVERRFDNWLAQQGRGFTPEQMEWLRIIKDQIATSVNVRMEDFEYALFHEKGGPVKIYQLSGDDLNNTSKNLMRCWRHDKCGENHQQNQKQYALFEGKV